MHKTSEKVSTKIKRVVKTNAEKALEPEKYIYNPDTENYVDRTKADGKALEQGKTVITDAKRLLIVVKRFKDNFNLTDARVKSILDGDVPRSFPIEWGGKLDGKKKKKKDKDQPKGARNALIFFGSHVREEAKKEAEKTKKDESDKSHVPTFQQINVLWNAVPASKKAVYEKMAKDDRVRFEREMNEYYEKNPDKKQKKTKTKKESGFERFTEERTQDESVDEMEILKEWNAMTPEEKYKYLTPEEKKKLENAKKKLELVSESETESEIEVKPKKTVKKVVKKAVKKTVKKVESDSDSNSDSETEVETKNPVEKTQESSPDEEE